MGEWERVIERMKRGEKGKQAWGWGWERRYLFLALWCCVCLILLGSFICRVLHYKLLKVGSPLCLLVCLVCLKESTCETKKNVLVFTSKALFVFEIIIFSLFEYSKVVTSSNMKYETHLLINSRSKHSLVMTFGD